MLVDHARKRPGAEQHEGELAALTDHEPEPRAPPLLSRPHHRPSTIKDDRLDDDEADDDGKQLAPALATSTPRSIDMPTAMKKTASSSPSNGRDVGLDLVAIFGIGEQRAGDERAERRRQPDRLHDQGHADHGQQRARRHRLAHAGRRATMR